MVVWSWVRRLLFEVGRGLLVAAGLRVLYLYSLEAFGGHDKLWMFEQLEPHRYTAMSMLTGTLRLRSGLSKLGHDEQVFNGAAYTNWSFGVPLLQLPFHALAGRMKSLPQKFFPDRAIYFIYFLAAVPVIWLAFDRLLARRQPPGSSTLRRHIVSWSATVFVLVMAFFPLMSCRFIVYEETICYFMLAEFLAVSAYIFAVGQWDSWAVALLGFAASLGLLIRPTGVPYMGVWVGLLLLERRTWRAVGTFAGAALPGVAFWAYSNWVKGGTPLAVGLTNSMPWLDYQTPMLRFGSPCTDTLEHTAQAAGRLFNSFVWRIPEAEPNHWPWMDKCHFGFEARPPPAGTNYDLLPFVGPVFFAALVWMVSHQLARRETRIAFYLPALGICALFVAFAKAGAGFAWRYVGDFWPLMVLAVVQYVRFLPRRADQLIGLPVAAIFLVCAWGSFDRNIRPWVSTIQTLDEAQAAKMWEDFSNSRYAQDKPMATKFTCTTHDTSWPYHNGQGWGAGCVVSTFTNLFIGVPDKGDDHYQLSFSTSGVAAPTLRVYVNGFIYEARRAGDHYVADVTIHYNRLNSPIVMTTIEWTKELEPTGTMKLLSVQLS